MTIPLFEYVRLRRKDGVEIMQFSYFRGRVKRPPLYGLKKKNNCEIKFKPQIFACLTYDALRLNHASKYKHL